ncbi:MAG: cyclase family protein [Candidatus Omnitrophica bacterium]|nr:cyclase family protein [Candidatus Omnitrophota bacterium]
MKIRFLSYPMDSQMPVYGFAAPAAPDIKKLRDLRKGDSSDSYWIGFNNHWGTHVDAPAHFFKNGRKAVDYPPDTWCFKRPQVLDVRLKPGELLRRQHIEGAVKKRSDLLLLRSGWAKRRGRPVYSLNNPGIHEETGFWLRKYFPGIRAVGFDWVSLSSHAWKEEGRAAHRAFLDPSGRGEPLLIIEDMDLSGVNRGLKEVWALPLRVKGPDSAPCTVVGVFR